MATRPQWETHSATGKRYFRYRQNEQIGYQLEDGTRLTQGQFDELNNHRDNRAVPRNFRLFPPENDEVAPQDSVVGSPPGGNYMAVRGDPPRETVTRHQDPSYRGPDQVPASYASDRNTRRPPEQANPANAQTDAAKDANRPAQFALPSRMSRLCTNFVSIAIGNYSELLSFILENKAIVSQSEIDSLISSAREEHRLGHESNAQTFVHHALLLRKCKELDDKERVLHFKRLDDRNSETRRDFLSSIRTVHTSLKGSARTSAQTPQNTDTHNQGRGLPSEVQAGVQASRHGAERPVQGRQSATAIQSDSPRAWLAQDESAAPDVRPPIRRAQMRDGRQVYVDESGRVILPASTRHESNRSGVWDDTDEMSGRMARTSMAENTPHDGRIRDTRSVGSEDPARHVEGANLAQQATPLERRTSVSYGDPMPTLPEGKVGGGREFKGTEGDTETLDPRYQKRSDAKNFFTRGRVFSLLWHESAGQGNTDMSRPIKVTRGRYGQEIYSHILRMVVVKEGHGACLCLPINTYGGRGVSKPGFSKADREAHSIIHMSDTKPKRLAAEAEMIKRPIAVDKSSPDQKLDEMSRLNFSRIHTVIWNVKVMNVGRVTRESIPALITYWKQALE